MEPTLDPFGEYVTLNSDGDTDEDIYVAVDRVLELGKRRPAIFLRINKCCDDGTHLHDDCIWLNEKQLTHLRAILNTTYSNAAPAVARNNQFIQREP